MKKLIVVAMAFMIIAATTQIAIAGDFVALADNAQNKFDNQSAMELYKKAAEASPEDFTIRRKLVESIINVGEDLDNEQSEKYYNEAIEMAKSMVAKRPDRAWSYYLVGLSGGRLASSKSGKEKVRLSRGIAENANKAIELDPKFHRAYILLGAYYREIANLSWLLKGFANLFLGGLPEGTNENALITLNKSLEIDSSLATIKYFELGKTYDAMGNTEQAIEYYQKTVESTKIDHYDDVRKKTAAERLEELKK